MSEVVKFDPRVVEAINDIYTDVNAVRTAHYRQLEELRQRCFDLNKEVELLREQVGFLRQEVKGLQSGAL